MPKVILTKILSKTSRSSRTIINYALESKNQTNIKMAGYDQSPIMAMDTCKRISQKHKTSYTEKRVNKSHAGYNYVNKASVLELQKFAKISVVDGVSNFAPQITTKKTDCWTHIL